MIGLNDFFTPTTLNIFCDASMLVNKYGETSTGCSGICCVYGAIDKRFPLLHTEPRFQIYKKATNNYTEAKAVLMGIQAAIEHKHEFQRIRILSDSQISIFNIRDRLINWKVGKKDPTKLIGSTGAIKNQDIFVEMLYTILQNELQVEFMHQAGHVVFTDQKTIDRAAKLFATSNNLRDEVDMELIRAISLYNNYVDRSSREFLHSVNLKETNPMYPLTYIYNDFDREMFYKLLHPDWEEN
jgi:ribonuclease HI